MKKLGDFYVTAAERAPKGSLVAKYLNIDLQSHGLIDLDLCDGFFNGDHLKVAVFVIPDGENSDDYELVKNNP